VIHDGQFEGFCTCRIDLFQTVQQIVTILGHLSSMVFKNIQQYFWLTKLSPPQASGLGIV
jgi:hypothetical protein